MRKPFFMSKAGVGEEPEGSAIGSEFHISEGRFFSLNDERFGKITHNF